MEKKQLLVLIVMLSIQSATKSLHNSLSANNPIHYQHIQNNKHIMNTAPIDLLALTGLSGPDHAHVVSKAAMAGHCVIGGLMDEKGIDLDNEFDDDLDATINDGMIDNKEDYCSLPPTPSSHLFMGLPNYYPHNKMYSIKKYRRELANQMGMRRGIGIRSSGGVDHLSASSAAMAAVQQVDGVDALSRTKGGYFKGYTAGYAAGFKYGHSGIGNLLPNNHLYYNRYNANTAAITAATMAGVNTGRCKNIYQYGQNIGNAAALAANAIARRNALHFRDYYGRPYGGYTRGTRGTTTNRYIRGTTNTFHHKVTRHYKTTYNNRGRTRAKAITRYRFR